MKFDRTFYQWYVSESVLDIHKSSLDPTVFQFPEEGLPVVHPRIRAQIMDDLVEINKIITILDYFIIGSILTDQYSNTSDIDVTVEIEEGVDPLKIERLIDILRVVSGRLAVGTLHPINYHIYSGTYDLEKTEAAYDVANERWIKEPSGKKYNVKRFIDKLKKELSTVDLATAELRRDLIDFKELKQLSKTDIEDLDLELVKSVSQIESDIANIVQIYDNAKMLRRSAFDKPMTPMEIRKFGMKNNLPENILYKLLERYFYKELATKLKELLRGGVDESDIPKIRKTFSDYLARV